MVEAGGVALGEKRQREQLAGPGRGVKAARAPRRGPRPVAWAADQVAARREAARPAPITSAPRWRSTACGRPRSPGPPPRRSRRSGPLRWRPRRSRPPPRRSRRSGPLRWRVAPVAATPEAVTPEPAAPVAAIPDRATLEDLLGGRVLAWVGGLAVLVGIVFLLAIAVSPRVDRRGARARRSWPG